MLLFKSIPLVSMAVMAIVVGFAAALAPGEAFAANFKIGFVSTERILRDAGPAKAAQKKLETEFAKREKEVQDLAARLRGISEKLERDAPVMSEAERGKRQREITDMERDLQRRQREFREDLNQRRNEELAAVVERANRAIKQIAEAEKYDIIFQEAVYASPGIDITEKVIRALNGPAGTK
ncbi:MAG: OmpH family outer membrane protein [Burkholderiaceae bacterium]|jgi:outer membrane protein|nr:OmpH family outer membrane protein [Burkholderiaceae bacterium]